jgi:hypothetical protein
MPSTRSSHGHTRNTTPSFSGERISSTVSRRSRRLAVFLLGIWFGGILLIGIAAPASFRSVDRVMAERQEIVGASVEKLGPVTTRDLLRYQIAEANRLLISIWGWVQFFLSASLLLLLVFLSNAKWLSLICSGLMAALAALSNFVLIPRIVEVGRSNLKGGGGAERFELMHSGFTTFQVTLLLLGLVLLLSLFRRRDTRSSSSGRDSAIF